MVYLLEMHFSGLLSVTVHAG